ncbi:hypothetical protein BH18CHL1_BH18CHL1_00590 [soil metagenome]
MAVISPRAGIWLFHLALPLVGLWVLLVRPDFDLAWEDHVAHLVLVGLATAISIVLALLVGRLAAEHGDARLTLVSLGFLASAGAFFLHAFSTPRTIVGGPNLNFLLSTPVGLTVASVFVLASSFDLTKGTAERVVRFRKWLVMAILVLMGGWAVASLQPPLSLPPAPGSAELLLVVSIPGAVLFITAAIFYLRLFVRRRSVISAALVTSFLLLAEAVIAIPLTPNWHASWWLWHILMALAYGFVVYSARVAYRREGSLGSLFQGISLEETVQLIRADYRQALDSYVATLASGGGAGRPHALIERFDLSEGQAAVLEQAGLAVASEREQIMRLDALAEVGRETLVEVDEKDLIDRALRRVRPGFPGDQLDYRGVGDGIDGSSAPEPAGTRLTVLVAVSGLEAGALVLTRPRGGLSHREQAVLEALSAQLAVAVANVRLYRQVEDLFRRYLSPAVATTLLADPKQAALGGEVRDVTVLFADLRGFTPFSERVDPAEVVALLNRYFAAAVPVILAEGGTIAQFVGDAVMAIFNAPDDLDDHAAHAARAAIGMQRAIAAVAGDDPRVPRFRIGVHSGPSLVGNIGSPQVRQYTAIGDTTNLAARLQTMADEGQVVLSGTTYERIRDRVTARGLGALTIKGKRDPVEAWELSAWDA